jgi:tRNA nucleotidyltransferase (CCA-adding enzyme)
MRKAASKIGKEYMELLFEVNYADTSAKNPKRNEEKFLRLTAARRLYQEILEQGECVSLKELSINGKDLIAKGFHPGRELGEILNHLLARVLENPEINTKETLLTLAIKMQSQGKEAKEAKES